MYLIMYIEVIEMLPIILMVGGALIGMVFPPLGIIMVLIGAAMIWGLL